MKRKTLGLMGAALAICALALLEPDVAAKPAWAQCASSSFSAGDCSASQAFSTYSYGAPMFYSAPMRAMPVYNSAGMCINCGRVHAPPTAMYAGGPVYTYADPLVNVHPPRVQLGIINIGQRPSRPTSATAATPVKYASSVRTKATIMESPKAAVRRDTIRWKDLTLRVDPYTGLCALK